MVFLPKHIKQSQTNTDPSAKSDEFINRINKLMRLFLQGKITAKNPDVIKYF